MTIPWPDLAYGIGSLIAVAVWLVRLEGRVNYNEKRTDVLQVKHDALDSKIMDEIVKIREDLAKISGYLQAIQAMQEDRK